ncbi:trypsin-like serine peptidase [Streptomyces sp. NPDC060031]|uniref:trypsin-like serine peptidase n=1 Tax=Streptomyces sp. NPDC060031 TaxID=3347043 RepID=UPI00368827DA
MFTKVRGRAVRASVFAGFCCVLLLGGAGYVWELRALAAFLDDGDPVRGSYAQDPGAADDTASAVLDGMAQEGLPPGDGDTGPVPGGGPEHRGSVRWQPSDPLEARPAPADPAVGALFSPGEDGDPDHHCSASVVHSPGGDLIATAAHCVHDGGFRTNLAFGPGYRDGFLPYGVWVPTRIDVDPRWVTGRDPDHDVAFLRMRRPGHPGQRLEDAVGAAGAIRFGAPLPAPARLMGYPNTAEEPLECRNNAVAAGPSQLRLDCADVPNGTSGGPVLTGDRTLIGVIGGRDGGGDEETSYSSRFDAAVRALYERAGRD